LLEAVAQIEKRYDEGESFQDKNGPFIVRGENWHPGVIGIVASRLVSRYHRSAIVFTEQTGQEGVLKGSARASGGYNMLEAIVYAQDSVEQFGGHTRAAGITVREECYTEFIEKIEEYSSKYSPEDGEDTVYIDAALAPEDVTMQTWRDLSVLEPYGEGNREPRFLARNACIKEAKTCGKGKHIRFALSFPGEDDMEIACEAIAFGYGPLEDMYCPTTKVDVVFELHCSRWKGKESLSIKVIDMHFSKSGRLLLDSPDVLETLYHNRLPIRQIALLAKSDTEHLLPGKEEIKVVYQFIRTRCGEGTNVCDLPLLARWISGNYRIEFHAFALARILDIFQEAGLLSVSSSDGMRVSFALLFVEGKVKLENTNTYRMIFERGGLPE
jgi:single-stranded-DNA-specific exonuclease